jgi:hypothetical protein
MVGKELAYLNMEAYRSNKDAGRNRTPLASNVAKGK